MSKQPNPKEAALIGKMQSTLKVYMKPDTREGGHYFEHGSEAEFQKHADDIADLIREQGVDKTYGTLVSLARELQKLGETEWNHANSIGFAFKRGLGEEASIIGPKVNPFTRKNFPKL